MWKGRGVTIIKMGLDLNIMAKMFKCLENDDIVTIKADYEHIVTFTFKHDFLGKNLEMYHIDHRRVGKFFEPKDHHAKVSMPSAEFARICKELGSSGDTVEISVNEEGVIKFYIEVDVGAATIVCRENMIADKPQDSTIIKVNQPVSLTVSLKYLNSFTKATPLSGTVTIHMSLDFPVKVQYNTDNMEAYIVFYLAPI